jgi:MFS family permease
MRKPKLWTKDFFIITFVQLFFALNFYLLMIIISVFATDKFDSSPSVAGLAASIFVIGSLFARFLTGRWIERIGRKKTLYGGLLLGVVMTLLYFVANNIFSLLVIRLLHGASFGIITTTAAIIVASIIPIERRGEGIGYFALSVTLATAIGPFLGMFLSQHGNYDVIFYCFCNRGGLKPCNYAIFICS